jgi:hypothetical protein
LGYLATCHAEQKLAEFSTRLHEKLHAPTFLQNQLGRSKRIAHNSLKLIQQVVAAK